MVTLEGFQKGTPERRNARVDALLRDVKARQEMVKGLLEDEDEAVSLDFVGSMSMRDSVDTLVVSIREKLGVSVGNLRECRNPDDAFKYLRSKAEGLGIFVLLIGDLGSFHSAISTEVFRGFALADNMAPFIVINDKDSKAAWSFTLMHELVHLWLGETGVSNVSSEASVERFCNDVAGEFLLPRSEIMHVPVSQDMQIAQLISVITDFSTQTNLSKTLVAYNLLKARKINRGQYNALSSTFRRFWREDRRASSGESGTPDYFVVRRHRMGPALISLVRRMIQDGAVTPTKAATILGVNPHAVGKVVGV
ncbi:MAG: ImmA/IrrE family metallo-endopeptidase [Candidatus Sedimenticola sp. (ex Thyasira tokunagai)]